MKMALVLERSGPITWAQQEWFAHLADLRADEDATQSFATNTSAVFTGMGLSVSTVIMALHDVVLRHEGLRSLITGAQDGRRTQSVCPVDGLTDVIQIVEQGLDADDAIAAAANTALRLSSQWPLLFVLVVEGDSVARIGVVVDHAAIDAWGWRVLDTDLSTALSARTKGFDPFDEAPSVEQPLDTAGWESGPAAERYAQRAERYWRIQLASLRRELDTWTPTPPAATTAPILHSHRLASGKAAAAAETITAATGIGASALYLLAFGSAIAAVEGTSVAGVRALVANRLSTGSQLSVRKAFMPATIVVRGEVRASFAERLTDVASQQLSAHRFANFEPRQAAALNAEILGGLQGSGAVAARFNYIDSSMVGDAVSTRSLRGESIPFTDPTIQGRITSHPPRPGGSPYILYVQHHPDGGLVTLECHEDTAWSPLAAEMLWHIEDLMVWAASGCVGTAPSFGRAR